MKAFLFLFSFFIATAATAQNSDDRKSIERAVLNYVEAFYEADTTKAYQSVATDLAKRGYYTRNNEVVEAKMTFEQLVRLSQRWKATQNITASTPKKVTVLDVLDKIAAAKVEAQWGIDYFHLAKVNGQWKIINVLWQEYPAK